MTALLEKAETKPVQDAQAPAKQGAAQPAAPAFEADDPVCVVLRGWGTPVLPLDRTSYLDGYAFTGGVARNIPYSEAKAWAKRGLVDKSHIFANNAEPADFARALGRDPLAPGNVAQALAMLDPEKFIALVGREKAEQMARQMLAELSARREGVS